MLMKYALERYNRLINVRLNPLLTNESDLEIEQFSEWIELSRRESENVITYLLRKSVSIKKNKELELLIQQYQAEIIQLLDIVFADKLKYGSEPFGGLFDAILKDLEQVLTHIEDRYGRYFNIDEKVPASYLTVMQADLRKRIKGLKGQIGGLEINERLAKNVFRPLNAFLRQERSVTYRQLFYVKDLVYEMEEWLKDDEVKTDQRSFLQLLLYLNYNASGVSDFIFQGIVIIINALPEQNQKIEKLADYLRQCNQAQIKPGVYFRSNLLPLKEQITAWIEEEMSYLKEMQRLLSVAPVTQDQLVADDEKVTFTTSVEVLALIARSAKDSKLIANKQMKGLFKIIVKFVRTVGCANLSSNSMLNKSYVAERKAKQVAIDLLNDMIKNLREY